MKLTIERAANGYVVRGDDRDDLAVVVGATDAAEAAQQLLFEVNERIGHVGSRYDAQRVSVIVAPGDKWSPGPGEMCDHLWVERYVLDGHPHWWCPCGSEFTPAVDPLPGPRQGGSSPELPA